MNHLPKNVVKPSSSTMKTTQRSTSTIGTRRTARLSTTPIRNNRQTNLLRKKESNSRPTSSSSSYTRRTIANEESENVNNNDSVLDPVPASTTAIAPVASSMDATGLATYGGMGAVSPYGLYGGAASMMPPSPYMGMGMGMGMGMNTMGTPYLSGLNQIVYGVQNIIFSISQAIQVVGANQQALQQAWESLNQMVDHAVATFHEMRALESVARECETEEEERKRKRLKALRYAFVFGGGWLAYKLIRNLLFRKRSLLQRQPQQLHQQSTPMPDYYNGQSYPNNTSIMPPSTTAMSSYSSPSNIYGATSSMGYPGYSGNFNGGNGYY